MRYRALDVNGDYQIGHGSANFLINSRECVAQKVLTRLRLWEGEWYLDLTDGTPWVQSVLGKSKQAVYDMAIRQRVLDTDGVTGISDYSSNLNDVPRSLSVDMLLDTVFGQVQVSTVLEKN